MSTIPMLDQYGTLFVVVGYELCRAAVKRTNARFKKNLCKKSLAMLNESQNISMCNTLAIKFTKNFAKHTEIEIEQYLFLHPPPPTGYGYDFIAK